MRRVPGRSGAVTAAALVAVTAACSEPALPEPEPTAEEPDDILAAEEPDPAREELGRAIGTLTSTVEAARDHLVAAAADDDATGARASAGEALALLLDESATSGSPGLFPSRTPERSASGTAEDDLLGATLAAAREAGGTLGRATVETLRDPVGGDLGAWERDAEGVVASAEEIVSGGRDVESITPAVMELPADGVRALAWTLLATETPDVEVTRAAAERASGHLSVVLVALSGLGDAQEPS